MLKTNSAQARIEFRRLRRENDVHHEYITFIHRNLPKEELNQYISREWKQIAEHLDIDVKEYQGKSKKELFNLIKEVRPNYQDSLREM